MFSWACSASHSASTCRAQHWPACARFRVFSSRHCRRCKITQNQDKSFSSWLAAARSRISWFALKEFYFWTLKRRFVWQAQGILHPAKSEEKRESFCGISKNDGRRGTLEEDLQRCIFRGRRSTRNMFIRDVRRSGRWFPETGCILDHQIFRFGKMI